MINGRMNLILFNGMKNHSSKQFFLSKGKKGLEKRKKKKENCSSNTS